MESEDGVTAELAREGWQEHHQIVPARGGEGNCPSGKPGDLGAFK